MVVFIDRSVEGHPEQIRMSRGGAVIGERQIATVEAIRDQLGQPRFRDRRPARLQCTHPFWIGIQTHDRATFGRQARRCDTAKMPQTEYADRSATHRDASYTGSTHSYFWTVY